MIQLKNVSKIYGKGDGAVVALDEVTLDIQDGKFTAIVGKSGSGKSTLMNIIGALDRVSEGEVIANDLPLTKMKDDALAEYRNKNIGYIFQSFYLEPTFTVLENIAMPLTIAGMPRKLREEKARIAIEKLDLVDKTNKKASELSGGQKQRVSIARALVHDPSIILADEPTGNLDSHNGAEVIRLLQDICNEGKTVVLVTHNMDDARKTDVMIEIKDGRIQSIKENTEEEKAQAMREYDDYDEHGNVKMSKEVSSAKAKADTEANAEILIEVIGDANAEITADTEKAPKAKKEKKAKAEKKADEIKADEIKADEIKVDEIKDIDKAEGDAPAQKKTKKETTKKVAEGDKE